MKATPLTVACMGSLSLLLFSCGKEREYEVRHWKVYPNVLGRIGQKIGSVDTSDASYYRHTDTIEVIQERRRYIGVDSISYIFYMYDSLLLRQPRLVEENFSAEIDIDTTVHYSIEKVAHYTIQLQDTTVLGYGVQIYPTPDNMSDMVLFVQGYGGIARFPYKGGGASRWFLERIERIKGGVVQQVIDLNAFGDRLLLGEIPIEYNVSPFSMQE